MKLFLFLLYAINSSVAANLLRQESSLDPGQWNQGLEADANHLLRVSIALTQQNTDLGVKTLLRISDPTSPDYGRHLSPKEVARMFAPRPNAIPEVMDWLEASGVNQSQVTLSYGGDRLFLDLSVQEAALLLDTTFYHQIHQETGQEQINCPHYHIPNSLAESIDHIFAASIVPTHQHVPRQQIVLTDEAHTSGPLPPNCLTQTTLSCLRNLYNIPTDISPHPNNSFGIFEPAWQTWLPEDLDEFFSKLQPDLVGHRPKVDAVNGGYRQRNITIPRFNQEPNLDFEYAMALTSPQEVTNVQVGSEKDTGNIDNMLAAFDAYYCDPINEDHQKYPDFYPPGCNTTSCDCGTLSAPKVVSISWGWTEAGFSPNYLQRTCLEFLKLGLMGTTVVVSISDHGTTSGGAHCIDDRSGNATDGKFSPLFPATCPWVTSVGGTQMLQPNDQRQGSITNETTFRQIVGKVQLSSGGGFSNVFQQPPYQAANVARYKELEKDHLDGIRDRFNSAGRGFPDVAARADAYMIATNGGWRPVYGSSASNPVFASMITLINSERMHAGKGSLGFINPALYSNPDILNDILTGANEGCGVDEAFRATRGWDAVTGLGSPDYERMRSFFMSLP